LITNIKILLLKKFKIRAISLLDISSLKAVKSMKIIYDRCSFNDLFNDVKAWPPVWRHVHDNDDTPPRGGTPVALPNPLPASVVFPMKLACGGGS
jgi:hypothetical protein